MSQPPAPIPPPPGPDNDIGKNIVQIIPPGEKEKGEKKEKPGLPPMIQMPLNVIKTIADIYVGVGPLVGVGAKMFGKKIPKELDHFLRAFSEADDPNDPAFARRLQNMIAGEEGEPGQEYDDDGIPLGKGNEPIMTDRMARQAYTWHYDQDMGMREIAKRFADMGTPVSVATVQRYIHDIEIEEAEAKSHRFAGVGRLLGVGVLYVGSVIGIVAIMHFLFGF
jgi:hypothetical protein